MRFTLRFAYPARRWGFIRNAIHRRSSPVCENILISYYCFCFALVHSNFFSSSFIEVTQSGSGPHTSSQSIFGTTTVASTLSLIVATLSPVWWWTLRRPTGSRFSTSRSLPGWYLQCHQDSRQCVAKVPLDHDLRKLMVCCHKKIKNNQVTADAKNFNTWPYFPKYLLALQWQRSDLFLRRSGFIIIIFHPCFHEVLGISGHLIVLNLLVTTIHYLCCFFANHRQEELCHTLPAILVTLKICL